MLFLHTPVCLLLLVLFQISFTSWDKDSTDSSGCNIYQIHLPDIKTLCPCVFMLCFSVFSPLSLLKGVSGNWIEIAYGTSSGAVRVIVQHPETVGSGPQLFQTFTVHRSPVTKIMLSEKHLVSGEEGVTRRRFRQSPC